MERVQVTDAPTPSDTVADDETTQSPNPPLIFIPTGDGRIAEGEHSHSHIVGTATHHPVSGPSLTVQVRRPSWEGRAPHNPLCPLPQEQCESLAVLHSYFDPESAVPGAPIVVDAHFRGEPVLALVGYTAGTEDPTTAAVIPLAILPLADNIVEFDIDPVALATRVQAVHDASLAQRQQRSPSLAQVQDLLDQLGIDLSQVRVIDATSLGSTSGDTSAPGMYL